MNKTLVEILKSREDLSDYLYHFTKGAHAKQTLLKIADDKALKDVGNKGVICFTEAPLLSLTRMFKVFDKYPTPMYAAYGVAIKKELVFELGGRPVIYGSTDEQKYLDPMIQWRFESFKPGEKDFTWLREWRLAMPALSLPADQVFFITKEKDLEILFDVENVEIDIDGDWADGQFHPYALGTAKRRYKGISIEELEQASNMSKAELDLIIAKQDDSDSESFSMGRIAF